MKFLSFVIFLLFTFNVFAINLIDDIPKIPYGIQVGDNKVLNAVGRCYLAHNESVGTTEVTLWHETLVAYVFPSAATIMTISSSDVDDLAGDTGARTVEVRGLNASYVEISEIVTLNGQTGVPTVNEYLRIQGDGIEVKTAGSTNSNEGYIYIGTGTITTGKPAVVYGVIEPGDSFSQVGVFTVPAGKRAFIVDILTTIAGTQAGEINFYLINGFEKQIHSFFLKGTGIGQTHSFPEKIPEMTDVEVRGKSALSTVEMKATYNVLFLN